MFIQIHRHLYGVGVLEAAPKHRDELNICPLATFQPSAPVMLSQESSAGTAPKAAGAGRCPTRTLRKVREEALGPWCSEQPGGSSEGVPAAQQLSCHGTWDG